MRCTVQMSPPTAIIDAFLRGATRDVGAGDFATIYNLNPLFAAGYSGWVRRSLFSKIPMYTT